MTGRARPGFLAVAGLAGAGLVRASLSADADSAQFYLLTAGLAANWTGAALSAGPPPAGPVRLGQLVRPALTGAATFGLFYGCARASRHWPMRSGLPPLEQRQEEITAAEGPSGQ